LIEKKVKLRMDELRDVEKKKIAEAFKAEKAKV